MEEVGLQIKIFVVDPGAGQINKLRTKFFIILIGFLIIGIIDAAGLVDEIPPGEQVVFSPGTVGADGEDLGIKVLFSFFNS